MRTHVRWMGLFALWGAGCAETLVIGSMRRDGGADEAGTLDVADAKVTPPDAASPLDATRCHHSNNATRCAASSTSGHACSAYFHCFGTPPRTSSRHPACAPSMSSSARD